MPIHIQIYEKIKSVARDGTTITYGEIAPMANLNMDREADRAKIGALLGEISTYEHAHGRPMLSVVVVLAGTGYPGTGFFNLANELGLHFGKTDLDDLEFFVKEIKRVHAFWEIYTE